MKTEIKANDLRVGNVLKFGNQFCIVSEIQKECFYAELKDGTGLKNTTCLIENVELTEELLLKKCGFSKPDKKDEFGGILSPELPNGNRIRLVNLEWRTNHFSVKFETLHHFQNWWYDNFKTELTINF